MPTPTYISLATVNLTTTDASVTFSNIPATYRDLVLVFDGTASPDNNGNVQFNGDTAANYSDIRMIGYPTDLFTSSAETGNSLITGAISTTRTNIIMNIMDYSATDKHKTTISRVNNQALGVIARVGRWASNSPINEVRFFLSTSSMQAGTTLTLYGIGA